MSTAPSIKTDLQITHGHPHFSVIRQDYVRALYVNCLHQDKAPSIRAMLISTKSFFFLSPSRIANRTKYHHIFWPIVARTQVYFHFQQFGTPQHITHRLIQPRAHSSFQTAPTAAVAATLPMPLISMFRSDDCNRRSSLICASSTLHLL